MILRSAAPSTASGFFALPSPEIDALESANAIIPRPSLAGILLSSDAGKSPARLFPAMPICLTLLPAEADSRLSNRFSQPTNKRQPQRIPTAKRIAHLAIEDEIRPLDMTRHPLRCHERAKNSPRLRDLPDGRR